MNFFESCRKCVPPKRQPGCQSHCPEYAADRAVYDGYKAEENKKRSVNNAIYTQRSKKITKALKKHGR